MPLEEFLPSTLLATKLIASIKFQYNLAVDKLGLLKEVDDIYLKMERTIHHIIIPTIPTRTRKGLQGLVSESF